MVPKTRSPLYTGMLIVMLGSLALAALMGVLAVFAGGSQLTVWLVCTAILIAGSCALTFYILRLLDAEATRRTGLLALVLGVVNFFIALCAIWSIGSHQGGMGLLSLEFFAFGTIACRMYYTTQLPGQFIAGWAGVVLSAIAFAVAAFSIALDSLQGSTSIDMQAVAWILEGTALVVVFNLIGLGTDSRHWRWFGVAGALLGVSLAAYVITHSAPANTTAMSLMTLGMVVGIISAHANMLLRVALVGWQRIMLGVTLSVGWISGACIWFGLTYPSDIAIPCAGAAGIIAGAGTLAVMIQGRFNRRIGPPTAAVVQFAEMAITCPFCKTNLTVATGDSTCTGCGLGFSIKVQEPRCANCDYLLLSLQSDKCPECGTPVPFRTTPLVQIPQ